MVSQAQIRAKKKYEKTHYWKPTIRCPKDFKERIEKSGQSTNAFILDAIKEKMERENL